MPRHAKRGTFIRPAVTFGQTLALLSLTTLALVFAASALLVVGVLK